MKIEINKTKFREAVDLCATCVGKTHLIPILQSILIDATGDNVFVIASNDHISMKAKLDNEACIVSEKGRCLVIGDKLSQILALDVSESVSLETKSNDMVVIRGAGTYKLSTLDATQYPEIVFNIKPVLSVNLMKFHETLRQLLPFICNDKSREGMMGILIDFVEQEWFMVAGDGQKMARTGFANGRIDGTLPKWLFNESLNSYRFLIMTDLIKIIGKINDDPIMYIGFSEDGQAPQISFINGNIECKGLAVNGIFPDWKRAHTTFGGMFTSYMELDRKLLLASMRKTMMDASVTTYSAYLFATSEGLRITNRDIVMAYSELLPYISSDINSHITYIVEPKYVVDFLSTMEGETVKIFVKDDFPDAMIVVDTANDYRAIIMLKKDKENV